MYSKDNKENQQKLNVYRYSTSKKCICKTMGYQPMKRGEKKSISVNRNYEIFFNLYYTLKAQYIMIKVGGLVITLEIHLF